MIRPRGSGAFAATSGVVEAVLEGAPVVASGAVVVDMLLHGSSVVGGTAVVIDGFAPPDGNGNDALGASEMLAACDEDSAQDACMSPIRKRSDTDDIIVFSRLPASIAVKTNNETPAYKTRNARITFGMTRGIAHNLGRTHAF